VRRLPGLLAALIAVGACLTAAWASQAVFDRIPHLEDEFANLWEAEVMTDGQIAQPSPSFPRSFLVPFVVDYQGLRFGKYPPGWPALLSLGIHLGVPWLVNALLAGAAAWLTFRLGSRLAGPGVGLLAALLIATSPMFLLLSASLMSHALSVFLTLAVTLGWLDGVLAERTPPGLPRALPIAVAGLCLGLLALTRPLTAVAVGLPFGIHGLWILARGRRPAKRAALAIGLLAFATAGLLLVWQWALTGDPLRNPYVLWWAYDRIGFGPGHGVTEAGHTLNLARINTKFSLRIGQHDLFGWPFLSWVFAPFGLLALRRRLEAWLLAALLPVLVLIYAAYWVGAWLYGPRYYVEALGALAVLSAAGIAGLAGWLGSTPLQRWRSLTVSAWVLVLLALNAAFYLPARLRQMTGLYGMTRAASLPLESLSLGKALVIVHPAQSWTEYGALLPLTPPFADSDLLLAYTRGTAQDTRLAQTYTDRPVYHLYLGAPARLIPVAR
jgi:4-amino-4-deoxy-L-arabinose transferase-like glycosyltransferase